MHRLVAGHTSGARLYQKIFSEQVSGRTARYARKTPLLAGVLGADDFAIRRGQHCGTLLIDIETGAPLDLLEGRDAQPLADWLAAHPG